LQESGTTEADIGRTFSEKRRSLIEDVKHTVEDVLGGGEPQSKWEKFWYDIDPFKQDQMVRSAKNFDKSNIYFGIFYFICVLLYAIFIFYEYFQRPEIETYTMIPSLKTNPIDIDISLKCSAKWPCSACSTGSWGTGWTCVNGTVLYPSVSETYQLTRGDYCQDISSSTSIWPTTQTSNFSLTACYSTSFEDGILIHVPFTGAYGTSTSPRMVITLTKPGSDLYYQQSLEPSQRKSVFLGQTVYEHYKKPTTTET
jgi:hypothetical protein